MLNRKVKPDAGKKILKKVKSQWVAVAAVGLGIGISAGVVAPTSVSAWTARTVVEISQDVETYDTIDRLSNYKLRWGDTLWGLSEATNFSVMDLAKAFNIENPNLIRAGKTLASSDMVESTNSQSNAFHTIVSGDTLSAIAPLFGATVSQLVEWNNIANPNLIFPGQVLQVTETVTEDTQLSEDETTEKESTVAVVEQNEEDAGNFAPVDNTKDEDSNENDVDAEIDSETDVKDEDDDYGNFAPVNPEEPSDIVDDEEPVVEEPVDEEPVVEEPVDDEPVVEEPVDEEPVDEEPVDEEPVDEEPVDEEPVVEEPVDEEPVDEEPVDEEPVVEEPVDEEPVDEEPVVEEPVDEEPVDEEPVVEEPVDEEPVVEEPVVEEPVVEEPVDEEPVVEEPVDEPINDDIPALPTASSSFVFNDEDRTVTITVVANEMAEGLAYISMPDGSEIAESVVTYTVSDSSTYLFYIFDNAGNYSTESVRVEMPAEPEKEVEVDDTIDTSLPVMPSAEISSRYVEYDHSEILTIAVNATQGGFSHVVNPDGTQSDAPVYEYKVTETNEYSFYVHDTLGNVTEVLFLVELPVVEDGAVDEGPWDEEPVVEDEVVVNDALVIPEQYTDAVLIAPSSEIQAIFDAVNGAAENGTMYYDVTNDVHRYEMWVDAKTVAMFGWNETEATAYATHISEQLIQAFYGDYTYINDYIQYDDFTNGLGTFIVFPGSAKE